MKKWLNDLKKGDTFWQVGDTDVFHRKHNGDVINMNFRMPRINVELIVDGNVTGLESQLYVNQYVYDEKFEAVEELLERLKKERIIKEAEIKEKQDDLREIENAIRRYDK